MGIRVWERFRDNFWALISKPLSDSPYVVKFLSYLIFLIYAAVAFEAYCCMRGLHISWYVKLANMLFKH